MDVHSQNDIFTITYNSANYQEEMEFEKLLEWCDENVTKRKWTVDSQYRWANVMICKICFNDKKDSTIFKLRWC